MKLTCQICGFESGNLVPHIEKEHSSVGLKAYMDQYGGVASVIHPKLTAKAKETGDSMMSKILGVDLDVKEPSAELAHHVPKLDPNYQFQPVAAEVLNDYAMKRPVMLIGHTGTGKTSLVQQIAARMNQPTIRANMNGQTSVTDFVGFWAVKAGETYWIDGVLPYAMKHGLWLIIDELDFADAPILSVLNSVLETNGSLVLKEKGNEIVNPHPDFRVFATANAAGQYSAFRGLYQGTNIMNEAFLDRWRCHIIEYMSADLEAKVLEASVDRMTADIATELVKVANHVRQAFTKEELQCTFSTRRLLDWSQNIVFHHKLKEQAPLKAAESTIFSKISVEDALVIKGIISRVLSLTND